MLKEVRFCIPQDALQSSLSS